MRTVQPDLAPTRTSAAIGGVTAASAVLVAATTRLELLLGVVSVLVVSQGLLQGTRSWLAAGVIGLVATTVVATLGEIAVLRALGAVALSFVAWDCGEYAIGLGETIGRHGSTTKQELRHAGSSIAVGGCSIALGWSVISLSPAGVPVVALVILSVGVVLLFILLWT
jgi:hypothetical protein